jgi:hypothetical protein
MSKGWWHDDGDGKSFTLWSSEEEYERYSAEAYGQVDYMLNMVSGRRGWHARAAISEDYPSIGWFKNAELAMQAVNKVLG